MTLNILGTRVNQMLSCRYPLMLICPIEIGFHPYESPDLFLRYWRIPFWASALYYVSRFRYRNWRSRKQSTNQSIPCSSVGNVRHASLPENDIHHLYSHTYDTIKEDSDYSQINSFRELDTEETTMESTLNSNSLVNIDQCQNSDSSGITETVFEKESDKYFKLSVNYTDPKDSIEVRKPKLNNKNSNTSYTYPYDSLTKR